MKITPKLQLFKIAITHLVRRKLQAKVKGRNYHSLGRKKGLLGIKLPRASLGRGEKNGRKTSGV